jgi:methyltransferase (TIGR00027 family)
LRGRDRPRTHKTTDTFVQRELHQRYIGSQDLVDGVRTRIQIAAKASRLVRAFGAAVMRSGQPSGTSLKAATLRAAHQILDHAAIFTDPLVLRIIGMDSASVLREADSYAVGTKLRWFLAMRARVAEDALAASMAEHGTSQIVILGAGLDTYAYREASRKDLHIFEVDHPATQAWKRELLAKAEIEEPKSLTFVPINFERQSLANALAAAGFDPEQKTFFIWLGVVYYLTREAISSTLRFMSGLPGGAEVVFDYGTPKRSLEAADAANRVVIAAKAAETGEELRTFFEPEDLYAELHACGFRQICDLRPSELARLFLTDSDASSLAGAHVLHAATF